MRNIFCTCPKLKKEKMPRSSATGIKSASPAAAYVAIQVAVRLRPLGGPSPQAMKKFASSEESHAATQLLHRY